MEYSEQFVYTNYDSAMIYSKLAADCFLEANNIKLYLFCLNGVVNLDRIYLRISEYENKNEWLLNLLNDYGETDELLKAGINNSRASYLVSVGKYEEAKELIISSLKDFRTTAENKYIKEMYHANLSSVYYLLADYRNCKAELENAILLSESLVENKRSRSFKFSLAKYYFELGRVNLILGKMDDAISDYQKCISKLNKSYQIIEKSEYLNRIVSNYIECNKNRMAIELINEVNYSILPTYVDSITYLENIIELGIIKDSCKIEETFFQIENIIENISHNPLIKEKETVKYLKLRKDKIHDCTNISYSDSFLNSIHNNILKSNESSNSFEKLDYIIHKIFQNIDQSNCLDSQDFIFLLEQCSNSRYLIDSENSKLNLNKRLTDIQSEIIKNLNSICVDENLIFEIFDLNKSSILSSEIANNLKKMEYGRYEIINEESRLNAYLNYLEEELLILKSKVNLSTFDSLQIKNLYFEISDTRVKGNIISKQIENELSDFYKLRKSNFISLSQVQNSLLKSDLVVESFTGIDFISFIFISKFKKEVISIANSDFNYFMNTLSDVILSKESKQSEFHKISTLLNLDSLDILNNKTRLIIVPDGPLYNLPFELLERNGKRLLDQYSISYQYSYKLLEVLKKHRSTDQKNKPFLGVSFPTNNTIASAERVCDDLELSKLSCAKHEIENIEEILKLERSKSDLTTDEFIEASKDARIIHIATHACPDEENYQMSRIHFKDDYLTNYDISAMSLDADLAVLSACETGYGKVIEGEGAMTIARAFFQAGVNTNIVSLWKVDDCSTAELMSYFYKHLYAGEDSDVALQKAKLDFLEHSHPQYHDPYYWAGFIHMGDTAPIFPKSNNRKFIYATFVLMALIIGTKTYMSSRRNAA